MALDKNARKALLDARAMTEAIIKTDSNEAETRPRIEKMLESLMGYNTLIHITREHTVHGIGDSNYCDFVIQLEQGGKIVPVIIVEAKRVNIDLADKHVKQAASYGINTGCEWIILTNAREWRIYHITFGQPPQAMLLDSWSLMNDDLSKLADKFELVSLKNVKRGALEQLWQKNNALTAQNLLKIILSEQSISMIRRELKRREKIALYPEEIVSGIRRMLNESAMGEMENIKISLARKQKPIVPKQECRPTEISQ
ncbi:MAG: type I restriction enzyme HsdR N-terminal domain-containing protein [Dehalococcoidia bacterium]